MASSVRPNRLILVVEDEPFIRMNALEMLLDAGFDVLEAADAQDAWSVLEAHPGIGMVFTDVNMPGPIDGLELARRIHRLRPDVRLIVTSGKVRPAAGDMPSGSFIGKPYGEKPFLALVEAAFAA